MQGLTWLYALFILWSLGFYVDPTTQIRNDSGNLRHHYNSQTEVQCQFRSATHHNATNGFLKIFFRLPNHDPSDYYMVYGIRGINDSLQTKIDTIRADQLWPGANNSFMARWKWTEIAGSSFYLKIGKRESSDLWEYEWLIRKGDPLILKETNTDWPVFESYISQLDTFQIESANPEIRNVFIHYYEHYFEAARPPISTGPGSIARNLRIDSVWSVALGQKMLLAKPGLYFIQSDSSSLEGISIRITDISYPKPGKIESLIAPLKYITTKSEYNLLQSAEDKKKAFDKFWLERTKDEQVAKENIRTYFQRISWSNHLFTNYKEGWKTDRGMIYIIFGLPLEVRRLPDREEWTYQRVNNSQVTLTFMKIPNIFSDQHYELVRRSDYDDFWFGTIDAWRTGGLLRR